MTDDRGLVARQGTNDGLCGIYCLINAVRNEKTFDGIPGEDFLRYFLEAAWRLNNLLPYKISNGYEEHELVDIFNEFARCHGITWRAHLLTRVRSSFPKLSPTVISKRIFEEGGQIVLHTKDAAHWFLAYTFDFEKGRYVVEDSAPTDVESSIDPKRVLGIGIVLLPAESALHTAF